MMYGLNLSLKAYYWCTGNLLQFLQSIILFYPNTPDQSFTKWICFHLLKASLKMCWKKCCLSFFTRPNRFLFQDEATAEGFILFMGQYSSLTVVTLFECFRKLQQPAHCKAENVCSLKIKLSVRLINRYLKFWQNSCYSSIHACLFTSILVPPRLSLGVPLGFFEWKFVVVNSSIHPN